MKYMSSNQRSHVRAAREMRLAATDAEKTLWNALLNRNVGGFRFYRERVIGRLIADFYYVAARPVDEVDGDIHDYHSDYDGIRTKQFEDHGYKVIRFRNDAILNGMDNVLMQIESAVRSRISDLTPSNPLSTLTPSPSPETGEGEGG